MKWIIILVGVLLIGSVQAIEQFGETWYNSCENGFCQHILYSGTRNVFEDGEWKRIEDANSLKDVWEKTYIEKDPDFDIDILEVNYTFINLSLSFNASNWQNYTECSGNPNDIKCDFKLTSKEEWVDENGTVHKTEEKFQYKYQLKNGELKTNMKYNQKGFPMNRTYTFGGNSTTIQLQDANIENFEDAGITSKLPTTNSGSALELYFRARDEEDEIRSAMLKFNTSSVPSSQSIDSSELCLYMTHNSLDSGEGIEINAHHVYQSSLYNISGVAWVEDDLTWNTRPTTSEEYNSSVEDSIIFLSSTTANDWYCWDVDNITESDYGNGYTNTTIFLNTTHYSGSPLSLDDLDFDSKESATSSQRPYLNVTYSVRIPRWSSNVTDIRDYDNSTDSQFNITWEGNTIDTVFMESNYTGATVNYTMNLISGGTSDGVWNYSDILSVGTWYYKSYANDTSGNENSTDMVFFNVSRGDTGIDMYINGTKNNNATLIYPSDVNVTCVINRTFQNAFTLLQNGTNKGTQDGQSIEYNVDLGVDGYNFTCNYSQTENYTSLEKTYFFTLNKGTPTVTVYANGSTSDTSAPIRSFINMTGTINTTYDVEFNISLNYTGFNDYSATGLSIENVTNLTASGKYNLTSHFGGDANWTAVSDMLWLDLTSSDVPAYSDLETRHSTPVEYNLIEHQFNSTWTGSLDIDVVTFEWNSTNYTADNTSSEFFYDFTFDRLNLGVYTYKWYANYSSGAEGFTDSYTYNLSINTTNTITLDMNGNLNQDVSVLTSDPVTIEATTNYTDAGTLNLFVDDSAVSNPYTNTFGTGDHTVVANITSNENYTQATERSYTIKSSTTAQEEGGGGGGGGFGIPITRGLEEIVPEAIIPIIRPLESPVIRAELLFVGLSILGVLYLQTTQKKKARKVF